MSNKPNMIEKPLKKGYTTPVLENLGSYQSLTMTLNIPLRVDGMFGSVDLRGSN